MKKVNYLLLVNDIAIKGYKTLKKALIGYANYIERDQENYIVLYSFDMGIIKESC